jgi:phenylpropionate dioxygenase-like ring-hydroxylating dioxygenase large terminal subunit
MTELSTAPPPSAGTAGSSAFLPTLSGPHYADPAIFALEQERIFSSLWFCAVQTADLAAPGAFRTCQAGRESVLCVRGADDQVRAFLNICRHRGARLCPAESGEVKRYLRCAYHSWSYALDGTLAGAPNLGPLRGIDPERYGLVPVAAREWLGYLWVCLADKPPSFEQTVIGAVTLRLGDPAAIGRYGIDHLALAHRISYDVRANWKLIIENFMECYHCASIHPELTAILPEFRRGYATQFYAGHGAQYAPGVQGFTVDGGPGQARLPGLAGDQDRRYYAVTILPQVFVNLVADHVILHRMFPVAADHTIVECDWLYPRDVIASRANLSSSVELFHRVNQQDFAACEQCQPAMASRGYAQGGLLVPSEHHLGDFHAWVRARLGEGPGLPPHDASSRSDAAAEMSGPVERGVR